MSIKIITPEVELFDEDNKEFITMKSYVLELEHSLLSLSKWEAIWNKPFLSTDNKTNKEIVSYIECMTINKNIPRLVYYHLPSKAYEDITNYIKAPMTATIINDQSKSKRNKEIVTSEIIYYWMIVHNIPLAMERWHLNRLLTLIQVCSIKSAPPKKMSKREIIETRERLNKERREKLNTKG